MRVQALCRALTLVLVAGLVLLAGAIPADAQHSCSTARPRRSGAGRW